MTWVQANAYARKMGKRLPSEQEWEKAARGQDGRRFPWGERFSPEFANTSEAGINSITPVDAYPEGKSPYGIMDLSGNLWEWTSTLFKGSDSFRVLKGGAYNGEAKFALCFNKFAYHQDGIMPTFGFRCAVSEDKIRS